jgi:Flp pilus assembly protein TadG
MTSRSLVSICQDRAGNAALEFALVAPVLCMFLMGGMNLAHTLYVRATLQGVVQKTARDSALETGTDEAVSAAIDAKVTRQALIFAKNASLTFSRPYYRTFADAAAKIRNLGPTLIITTLAITTNLTKMTITMAVGTPMVATKVRAEPRTALCTPSR